MDKFMMPQKGKRADNADKRGGEWSFVECETTSDMTQKSTT